MTLFCPVLGALLTNAMSLQLRPPCILGVGTNYQDHIDELKGQRPEYPVIFFKNPASVIANGMAIEIPTIARTSQLGVDYEGELAVVLGRDARDVAVGDALSYISHVAVANDVSQRWWQKISDGGQWSRAKSFDTFCPLSEPLGIEAVGDLQDLTLETHLNGELVQQANTGSMIFSVVDLISQLSAGTTLVGGTVILTGTPGGVGMGRVPQRFLRHGDVVDVTIHGVGRLSNPVVDVF
jgi:2-keto-4-pentenoate hydratase/2-oxohepta-3-ene-1,7-dioic acid hydratase in catechol pathway